MAIHKTEVEVIPELQIFKPKCICGWVGISVSPSKESIGNEEIIYGSRPSANIQLKNHLRSLIYSRSEIHYA